jgi:hypothetical protein
VRMRRTVRIAIVAAALGVTVGVIAVIIVVGAVFSMIDRPASEARRSHGVETTSARVVAAPAAPARKGPCQDQTWPYIESQCLTRAEGGPQPLADQANPTERAPNAVVQRPASGTNATTGIAPSSVTPVMDGGDAVPKAIIETRPLATSPQAQRGLASPSQTQSQSTDSAAHETETPVREKERKKAVVSRQDRQKAKLDEQKAEREESRRDSLSNRQATWGRNSEDRQADDESEERRLDRAVMESQSDDAQRPRADGVRAPPATDGRAVDRRATKATRLRKAARPHLPARDVVEENESQSRGGFFGSFFGGDSD